MVIPHWDQPDRCLATVEAFAEQGVTGPIWVVDNGSAPAATERLRAGLDRRAQVELMVLPANVGFGPATNVGLRRWLETDPAEAGEWVVVAPHDARPAPDCLRQILAAVADRPGAGLACADVGDGQTPIVDPYFGGITRPARVGAGWEPAGYPHGTLLVARRACLEEIGLFDERYFAYGEEADLGRRATSAGWEVGIVRGARVHNPHLGGRLDVIDYLKLRNTLLLVREHSGGYHAFIRAVIALVHLGIGTLAPGRRPEIYVPSARLRALYDFARARFGPPPGHPSRSVAQGSN